MRRADPAYNPGVLKPSVGRLVLLFGTLLLLTLPGAPGRAESFAGLCPDGSAFVVARREDAPCRDPKFVDASDMPPLRPQYIPRSQAWQLNRQARDENNPYNLVDRREGVVQNLGTKAAEKPSVAASATAGTPATGGLAAGLGAQAARAPALPLENGPAFALSEDELRDLARLIVLRQQVAPAELTVEDVRGRPQLLLRYAYSPSFEERALAALGLDKARSRVLLFSVRSEAEVEFFPNFSVIQDGVSARPEPGRRSELGFVLGAPGKMAAGLVSIGYMVLPARVDPGRPLDLWWNDRKLGAVLRRP
jgi:hypothetical protein